MENLSKHFSLDYLVTGSGRAPSSNQPSPLDEAVVMYSAPFLRALRAAPNRELKFHELLKQTAPEIQNPNFDQSLHVIRSLEKLKFVEVAQEDPYGNHLIRAVL